MKHGFRMGYLLLATLTGGCAHTATPRDCVEKTALAVSNLMTEVVKVHVVYEHQREANEALENNLSRTGAIYGCVLLPNGARLASWNPGGIREPTLQEVQDESVLVRGDLLFAVSAVYEIRDYAAGDEKAPEAIAWMVTGFML